MYKKYIRGEYMKKKNARVLVACLLIVLLFFRPEGVVYAANTLALVYDGKSVNYNKAQVGFTINGKAIDVKNTPGIIIDDTSMGYYVDVIKNG